MMSASYQSLLAGDSNKGPCSGKSDGRSRMRIAGGVGVMFPAPSGYPTAPPERLTRA